MGLSRKVIGASDAVRFDGRLSQAESKLETVNQSLVKANRQTQTLQAGINVLDVKESTPVDIEIQGRTLVSMANSRLQNGKHYVLADKKTQVWADGAFVSGVGKFKKSDNLVTKANFEGKVSGSTAANPHAVKYDTSAAATVLLSPNSTEFAELGSSNTTNMWSLDGKSYANTRLTDRVIPQILFSFNIIEQIERKMGRIPAADLAGKVQWVKDNVNRLSVIWHGFGSGPAGSKANLTMWSNNSNAWYGTPISHTASTVTKITMNTSGTSLASFVGSDGVFHALSYAEPSDGVTASTINTDFIELEIELKTTAVLDTKPAIIRTANFEGKVSGSTVENPHKLSYMGASSLQPISSNFTETGTASYEKTLTINSDSHRVSTPSNTSMAQTLFSFDLIAEIERNIGKIPAKDTAGKVQWLKDNVAKFTVHWHGYGSSPTGNKATLVIWHGTANVWTGGVSHTDSTVKKLSKQQDALKYPGDSELIDPNGFLHYLAHAEPSDGTTASTINTDYVELQIELKNTANFHHPIVPLYEVEQADYDKVLVSWNEAEVLNRYPRVQGLQHLQNPAVIAEGENLLPPFYEWNLHANATVKGPYELELNALSPSQYSAFNVKIPKNTMLTYSMDRSADARIAVKGVNTGEWLSVYTTSNPVTFFSGNNDELTVYVANGATNGKYEFKNPMLTLGATPKPFAPRNPSYLFATAKLGQIGDKKDVLFKQDGAYYVRKSIEKDVVLDGSLAWVFGTDYAGFKRVRITLSTNGVASFDNSYIIKFDGRMLRRPNSNTTSDSDQTFLDVGATVFVSISDIDTGWADAYTPGSNDIKRYFNGWKYTDGTTWVSVTGNGQTATAQQALDTKPTDYTPYKLSYVLATPKTEPAQVEGDIAVNGQTQVEVTSGVIVREKANPKLDGDGYYKVNLTNMNNTLSRKIKRALALYKNSSAEKDWTSYNSGYAHGEQAIRIPAGVFDTTAEYSVTYLVLDRHLFTCEPNDVTKATYSNDIRSALGDVINQQSDIATVNSVTLQAIAELYKRVKALGG